MLWAWGEHVLSRSWGKTTDNGFPTDGLFLAHPLDCVALTVRCDESQFQHAGTPGAVCLDEWTCFLRLVSEIIFVSFPQKLQQLVIWIKV